MLNNNNVEIRWAVGGHHHVVEHFRTFLSPQNKLNRVFTWSCRSSPEPGLATYSGLFLAQCRGHLVAEPHKSSIGVFLEKYIYIAIYC